MKKVLQIPNYQYPHIGGIEQVARDIADSLLDDKEIEQKMICFNEDAQASNYVCHGFYVYIHISIHIYAPPNSELFRFVPL